MRAAAAVTAADRGCVKTSASEIFTQQFTERERFKDRILHQQPDRQLYAQFLSNKNFERCVFTRPGP
jgi:hypothetical protein